MNKDNKSYGLWIGLGIAAAIAIFAVVSYSSAVAFGAQSERQLQATLDNNKNILGNYTTRVAEMAQVPAMARDDLKEVMEAAFNGRYGDNGSQATMQWIKEAYPGTLDPVLYRNIQATIESGRLDFQRNQTLLLDQKRVYQTNLDYVFKGFWLRLAGYPKINLDSIKIVTSSSAERSFETGVDDGVTLRPAK
jgi:hypothetical protein